jgi:large subunit ribosomal protein L32
MVNRMRANRSHRDNRRSHHALDAMRLTTDATSGSIHQRHRVDLSTGLYRGRQMIDMSKKAPVTAESTAKTSPASKK